MSAYTTDRAQLLEYQLDIVQDEKRKLRIALTTILTTKDLEEIRRVTRDALAYTS